jgi:hypothetical protein
MENIVINSLTALSALIQTIPNASTEASLESPTRSPRRASSVRRMEHILTTPHSLQLQQLGRSETSQSAQLSNKDFLLRNYSDVAISTDLEPDDVEALRLIFAEANRLYQQSPGSKYPINLIIVGEGNTAIKKLRMEKLMATYFDLPPGVEIRVVEGKATKGNLFPYDGLELFSEKEMKAIPFPEEGREKQAIAALEAWAKASKKPFLIQLKPASELLSLDKEAAKKMTVFFYGSFNFRQTVLDAKELEGLIDYFSQHFEKIGIIESFGVLGKEPSISWEFPWSHKIATRILESKEPYFVMFREFCHFWNRYSVEMFLEGSAKTIEKLLETHPKEQGLKEISANIQALQQELSLGRIKELKAQVFEPKNPELKKLPGWGGLERRVGLVDKIASSPIQFTLADILVAMAVREDGHRLFQATPIKATYNAEGFLISKPDPTSNVVYYGPAKHEEVANYLEHN